MSVIKKTPAIETILGRLNATQLAAVKTALNSTTPEVQKTYATLATLTSESPTDIATYQLQLDSQKIRNGVCVRILKSSVLYENLLVYGDSQKITIYEFNSSAHTHKLIEEYCDINELRRVLDEKAAGGSDEWAEQMKNKIYIDDDDICQHTEPSEFQEDVKFDGDIKVQYANKFKDSGGDTFTLAPNPGENDLGKVLKVGSTGPMWENESGAAKLYLHIVHCWCYNTYQSDQNKSHLYCRLPTSAPITTMTQLKNVAVCFIGSYGSVKYYDSSTSTVKSFNGTLYNVYPNGNNIQILAKISDQEVLQKDIVSIYRDEVTEIVLPTTQGE